MVHTIYILKLVVFFAIGGITAATATSGLPAFWHVSEWWNQPIVYQKVIVWTVLLEAIGVAGSWGPLAGKVKPMTGGILFWARPGTIRLRPWKWMPFTNGDRRTVLDVVLYFALLVSLAVALVSPGVHSDSLSAAVPDNASGLVNPALLVAPIVLLVLNGLRDKTIFLAARGEQYLPALIFFTVLRAAGWTRVHSFASPTACSRRWDRGLAQTGPPELPRPQLKLTASAPSPYPIGGSPRRRPRSRGSARDDLSNPDIAGYSSARTHSIGLGGVRQARRTSSHSH